MRSPIRLRPRLVSLENRCLPATFTVLNADDAGPGSLRQALLDANALPGSDEVAFDPKFFATPRTISLKTGELLVADDVTVDGPGASRLTVSGNDASRVLRVDGPGNLLVAISGLTIADGRTTDGLTFNSTLGDGAGVLNEDEFVSFENVVVRDNASDGEGGGIGVGADGRLTLRNCTVSGNTAGGNGAGVYFLYNGDLLIEDSTITGNTSASFGGGVYFYAYSPSTAVIRNTTISGNAASDGGGLYFAGPDLLIEDSTISGNTADGLGGGLYLYAYGPSNVTIRGSTISGNSASLGGGIEISFLASSGATIENCTISGNMAASDGGGLYFNAYEPSSLTILNSTISGNTAEGNGGGIAFYGSYESPALTTLTVTDSTISGNTAAGSGGGIWKYYGTATVQSSTITGNSAADGGGIHISYESVTLQSTIVAGNSIGGAPAATADLSCLDAIDVDGDNNLVGIMDPSNNATLTGSGNLTGTVGTPRNPLLGPLTNNGGPTLTHALLVGSPAIDAGNNVAGTTTDQRGAGFVRAFGLATDIGAFEVQPSPPSVQSVAINGGAVQRSRVTNLAVTFSAPVTFAGAVADAFTLTRNGGGAVAFTATSSVVNGVTVVTLNNFTGPETQSGSLADGRYTLTALATQISANGQQMAGNYTFGDGQGLYRYFGDMTGDRRIDIADFGFFSLAYFNPLNFNAALDFNNDGRIDVTDFGQFSVRFFTSLP